MADGRADGRGAERRSDAQHAGCHDSLCWQGGCGRAPPMLRPDARRPPVHSAAGGRGAAAGAGRRARAALGR